MARKPVAFPHQWNSNLPLSLPPLFLTPTLALASSAPSTSIQVQPLSSTAAHAQRPSRRDRNRLRGVSAIRRTGPRWPLSMSQYELPRPVKDPPQRKEFKTNPDHGLWGFFNKGRTAMNKPEDDVAHGTHHYICIRWRKCGNADGACIRTCVDVSRAEYKVL